MHARNKRGVHSACLEGHASGEYISCKPLCLQQHPAYCWGSGHSKFETFNESIWVISQNAYAECKQHTFHLHICIYQDLNEEDEAEIEKFGLQNAIRTLNKEFYEERRRWRHEKLLLEGELMLQTSRNGELKLKVLSNRVAVALDPLVSSRAGPAPAAAVQNDLGERLQHLEAEAAKWYAERKNLQHQIMALSRSQGPANASLAALEEERWALQGRTATTANPRLARWMPAQTLILGCHGAKIFRQPSQVRGCLREQHWKLPRAGLLQACHRLHRKEERKKERLCTSSLAVCLKERSPDLEGRAPPHRPRGRAL
eukprot:1147499-Pelagomonas_calceolata.AAC.3